MTVRKVITHFFYQIIDCLGVMHVINYRHSALLAYINATIIFQNSFVIQRNKTLILYFTRFTIIKKLRWDMVFVNKILYQRAARLFQLGNFINHLEWQILNIFFEYLSIILINPPLKIFSKMSFLFRMINLEKVKFAGIAIP